MLSIRLDVASARCGCLSGYRLLLWEVRGGIRFPCEPFIVTYGYAVLLWGLPECILDP